MVKRSALISAVALMIAAGASVVSAQTPAAPGAAAPPAAAPAAPAQPQGPRNLAGVMPPPAAKQIYVDNCSSCHGVDLSGGRAPSLFAERLLSERTDSDIHKTVTTGIESAGMPPFTGVLTDEQIYLAIAYLRTESVNMKGAMPFIASPDGRVIESQKQKFKMEVVAPGLEAPWGLAFLPDGRLLVTERPGRLRIVEKGKLLAEPVKNTPKVWERQDAGMLDVMPHPNFRRNGWIYLSYAELQPGAVVPPPPAPGTRPVNPPSMTVVIRGRINKNNEWVDTQEIFRAKNELYSAPGSHYGSRFAFDKQNHLFFTIGERGVMANAQDLTNPLGKVHRVNDDGSIPKDNPFVNTPGAVASIWSYGHRNPQGLSWDPVTGLLWESEHGPTGGDEINIVEKGKNYGWGVISMGIQPGITKREAPGMEQPVAYYVPTIAPSGIMFYTGSRYPSWKNNLFVAALAGQQLRRLEVKDRKVVSQEIVFQEFGRTRAVTTGPDGLMYVLLQNPTGGPAGVSLSASTPGMLVRLVPEK